MNNTYLIVLCLSPGNVLAEPFAPVWNILGRHSDGSRDKLSYYLSKAKRKVDIRQERDTRELVPNLTRCNELRIPPNDFSFHQVRLFVTYHDTGVQYSLSCDYMWPLSIKIEVRYQWRY